MFEVIGWVGTACVIISYCFDGKALRYINIAGSIFTIIYGISYGLYPIIALNVLVGIINSIKLMSNKKGV